MVQRKILLLSVSAGNGHVRAAQALQAYAQQWPELQCLHLDAMDFVPPWFKQVYADFYGTLVNRFSPLWEQVYKRTNAALPQDRMQRWRRSFEFALTKRLRKAIADYAPDAIICTHFLPAEMLARMRERGLMTTPLWVQVTDFGLHSMWVLPAMTGYFVANEELAWHLAQRGIAPAQVTVTGIPVMPAFAQPLPREVCAAELGLDAARPTALLMSGGAGVGDMASLAKALVQTFPRLQLIALAGKNKQALQALQNLASQFAGQLFPQEFSTTPERFFACADIVLTKPGGLSLSEALALGKPLILHSPIPGQEQENADYLLEHGAAYKASGVHSLLYRLGLLLEQPQRMEAMRSQASTLAHPQAAQAVLQSVMQFLDDADANAQGVQC